MRSDRIYKDGVLKGLRVALEHLDDVFADYEPGSCQRQALWCVKKELTLLFKVTRDTPSFAVRDSFKD